jgi:hypothetical protein
VIRKVDMVIIMKREGIDIEYEDIKRMSIKVKKIGMIKWVVECVVIDIMKK